MAKNQIFVTASIIDLVHLAHRSKKENGEMLLAINALDSFISAYPDEIILPVHAANLTARTSLIERAKKYDLLFSYAEVLRNANLANTVVDLPNGAASKLASITVTCLGLRSPRLAHRFARFGAMYFPNDAKLIELRDDTAVPLSAAAAISTSRRQAAAFKP